MAIETNDEVSRVSGWRRLKGIFLLFTVLSFPAGYGYRLVQAVRSEHSKPHRHLIWPVPEVNVIIGTPRAVTKSGGVAPGTPVSGINEPVGPEGSKPAGGGNDDIQVSCGVEIEGLRLPLPIPDWLCLLLIVLAGCFIGVFIILAALVEAMCATDWVKEEQSYTRCKKKKCSRWNIKCHIKKFLCYVEEFFRWIAQWICANVLLFLIVNFVLCVIAMLIWLFL
jgi:hypothetical protein